jgi:hypothetical protein
MVLGELTIRVGDASLPGGDSVGKGFTVAGPIDGLGEGGGLVVVGEEAEVVIAWPNYPSCYSLPPPST